MYGDTPMDTVADTWLKLGSRLVVFTRGADGLVAYYRTDCFGKLLVGNPKDNHTQSDAHSR